MTTSAFLAANKALVGVNVPGPSAGNPAGAYPVTSTYAFLPTGVSAAPTNTSSLDWYNWHKAMWQSAGGTRKPQSVRIYKGSSGQQGTTANIAVTTGVTGSAGAYGFITADDRDMANDGAALTITFKYRKATEWGTLAANLNASTDNTDKQAFRNLAQNLRRWVADTGNTATVKKVILDYHHEPENDGGVASEYRSASRAIVEYLARRGVGHAALKPNVALDSDVTGGFVDCIEWAFCGIGWNDLATPSSFPWWPGDDYFLWALFDPYNWGGGQSSPDGTTSGGAGQGKVLQPGDVSGPNYAKSWSPFKQACQRMLNWSDLHPGVLLGIGEFATSEYVDQFTGGNSATLRTPKIHSAKPTLKGEWLRQVVPFVKGNASDSGVDALNAFTADPRGTRIKMLNYWHHQAAMPRQYNTVPFQVGDTTAPTTSGGAKSASTDGMVALVNDAWFSSGGTPTPNPTVTLAGTKDSTGLTYTFTADAVAGSGTVTGFTFDYGDGTTPDTVSGAGPATATHTYVADGIYTVTVTVTDSGGGTGVRRIAYVVAGADTGGGSRPVEPYTNSPLLMAGDRVRELRFILNPQVLQLAQYTKDRTSRRDLKTITGTTYTLDPTDAGCTLIFTSSSAVTVTVPANSTAAFAPGAMVRLYQRGTGAVSVAVATGVTALERAGTATLRAQYSQAELVQLGIDAWTLVGDLTAASSGGGGGGGITPTTDDVFIHDFNEGSTGASLVVTGQWDAHVGTDATYSTDAIAGLAAYFNTTAQTSYYRDDFTSVSLLWFAFYIKVAAYPSAAMTVAQWKKSGTNIGDLRMSTAGVLSLRDNFTGVGGSTTALALNAWHRVSVKVQPGSSTGHELNIYSGADLNTMTPTQNPTAGTATATAQTSVDQLFLGPSSSVTTQFRIDRLRGNSTVEPSPAP